MSASSATLGVRNASLLARHRSLSVDVSSSSRPRFGTPLARRGRVSGLLDGIFLCLKKDFTQLFQVWASMWCSHLVIRSNYGNYC
ncbi:hypothetical protein MUK42_04135 [Musa troglodytarum]|uniref:Uncharacterized protein n=1 Tax=Musa troglodytarum TaxID=320322 RepID=A0A9E7GDY3_9LILI|nr:hypothetical protein MUK42_32170 [Musa troglodytarum]URE12910.1 hypothetical protein MUK42_04135 [Musa troglodytarum]